MHMSAFEQSEREIVAKLALDLLTGHPAPTAFCLVAELDGAVAGHIAFSPVEITGAPGLRACILAPLGVKPEHQRHGIGTSLIEHGMQALADNGVHIMFVYGDPAYYGRFGFSATAAAPYVPPYKLQYEFGWQAAVLNDHTALQSSAPIACVKALCDPQLW